MLQLLATVERVTVLQQTDVVLTDLRHHVLCSVDLTQRQLVVVAVVQNVDEIGKEGVDFLHSHASPNTHLQTRKLVNNGLELLDCVLLCELHLSHVERLNTLDLETSDSFRNPYPLPGSHHSGRLPLRLGEDNIDQFVSIRNGCDTLKVLGHTDLGTRKETKKWVQGTLLWFFSKPPVLDVTPVSPTNRTQSHYENPLIDP